MTCRPARAASGTIALAMPLPTDTAPPPPRRVTAITGDGTTAHAYPPRLDALTPLRFAAATLVVAAHGADRLGFTLGPVWPYAMGSAVSFFFVLSGFVLAYNYASLGRGAPTRRYLVMRVARIWPMHLLGLAAALAMIPSHAWVQPGIDPTIAAALVVTLTQTWFTLIPGYAGAYNAPAWTLSVDVFCYLVFPWLLARMRAAPLATFGLALAASVACPLVATVLGPTNAGNPVTSWNWYMLDRSFPLARLAEFTLGMLVAQALPRIRARLPATRVVATAAEAAVLVVLAAAMAQVHWMPHAARWIGPAFADWLGQVGAAPFCALAIAVFAHGRGALTALLSTRPAVHLGDLAYGVYILHLPLLTLNVWPSLATTAGRGVAALLVTLVLLALAHVAWRLVELPGRHAIVQAFERRRRRIAASAAALPNA
jgi:peptidoglycan/LPS O-acetylase OafA/YrhL